MVENDEHPLKVDPAKIPNLKPAFRANGTITPAASSANADGAAALVLTRRSIAEREGLPIMAEIKGHSTHSQEPAWFTTAPIPAIRKLLDNRLAGQPTMLICSRSTKPSLVAPMAAARDLGIPARETEHQRAAPALSAIRSAPPGARLIVTLLHAMEKNNVSKGIASLCIGGGEATAIAIERKTH